MYFHLHFPYVMIIQLLRFAFLGVSPAINSKHKESNDPEVISKWLETKTQNKRQKVDVLSFTSLLMLMKKLRKYMLNAVTEN